MNALALVLVALAAQPGTMVRGRVVDADSEVPVANAAVQLSGAGYARLTFTNGRGEYEFADVPGGRYGLFVTHPGFASATIRFELANALGVELDVPVTLQPIRTRGIAVVARQGSRDPVGDDGPGTDPTEPPSPMRRWLSAGPQSASGLSDMVAARAAANPPDRQGREGSHVLYLWGSNGEQGRVLLDGATLAAPLHLGGLLSPIDPDLLELAEPRSGGASPRFDGGTTSIMEFSTRASRGDRFRSWFEFDALTGRAGVETPIAASGRVLAGARRINSGLIEHITGQSLGYGYADALVRGDWTLAERDRVSLTGFASDESVTIPRDFETDQASWRNLAAALRWQRSLDDGDQSLAVAWSRGSAGLPVLTAASARGLSDVDRFAATFERTHQMGNARPTFGMDFERLGFVRRTRIGSDEVCPDASACFDSGITLVAPWIELVHQPRPGLRWSGGLRLSYNAELRRLDPLPRASLTALLGVNTAVTASAGRYSRSTVALPGVGPVLNDSVAPVGVGAAVARATHLELSVARRTVMTAFGATAFLRRHDALAGTAAHSTPGLELWWSRADAHSSVSLGYSFARIGLDHTDRHSRHVLAATLSRSVGPLRTYLSSAWARGLPFVSVVLDDPNAAVPVLFDQEPLVAEAVDQPTGEYVRLDATVAADWTVQVLGRPTRLSPYVKLMNALGRRDALFYFQEAGPDGGTRALATLPLVPTLGLRWVF